MKTLSIELLPLRPAVRTDVPVTLDVLVRITPPSLEAADTGSVRPLLNLGLVLDHSGSMTGQHKMEFARQAAIFAVQQLLPDDRVSVTIFDDEVDTLVPSTLAVDKQSIIDRINRIQPDGSTALHAGWVDGAEQVRSHKVPKGLNRVLLLTDGLANVGECLPDNIATDVKRMSLAGVTTSALGVGNDYNEDLLEMMALSGDGNYYYVESPNQLPDIFQTELHGLMATVGQAVRLRLEALDKVDIVDVLNDLERIPDGRLALPNVIVGMPIEIVLRLNVPSRTGTTDLCRLDLSWSDPQTGDCTQSATLTLPAVSDADFAVLAPDVHVQERSALLLAGRYKREASKYLDRRDVQAAREWLTKARQVIAALPRSPALEQEEADIAALEAKLHVEDYVGTSKLAKFQSYTQTHSRRTPRA